MKFIFSWRLWTLIVLAFGALSVRADTPIITFNATVSTNQIVQTNTVTYTFTLTNNVGINLQNVVITNTFSSPVVVTTNFNSPQGSAYYSSDTTNTIIFNLGTISYLTNGLQVYFSVIPQTLGTLTNAVVLNSFGTNTATTNLLTQVINAQADLSVAFTNYTPFAYVNDWLTYGIVVSNAGPGNVTSVVLGDTLPPGLKLLSLSPTNPAPTIISNILYFSLGTLNSGSSQQFRLTFQPTNSGIYNLGLAIGALGLQDPNTNNNVIFTNLVISDYPATALVVVTNSPQKLNPQNGLIEQSILVTNAGPGSALAVRVVVSGLTNRLFNATGTNNGNPFVTSPAALAVNQKVSLLLQYYSVSRSVFAFSNSQLQAEAVVMPALTPPAAASTSATNNAYILRQANGNIMIEFPAVAGTNYTIVYADNVLFSNAQMILPSIKAPANWVQWVDYGPPATATHPTNTPQRYYRVFLNP